MKTTSISIVIPVYNGSATLASLVNAIKKVCQANDYKYQIILVNNGSADNSWEIIKKLASQSPETIGFNLARNYGQHTANLCGFRNSTYEYIITMDDDFQNPPSEIPRFINKALEGYDLVIGRFKSKQHSTWRRTGSVIVQLLNRSIFEIERGLDLSNYRCIHRSVIDSIIARKHYRPYIPGLILEHSFNRVNIEVKHFRRKYGSSNYNMVKIVRLTSDLLFNHSTIPLRAGAAIGFGATALCMLLSVTLITQSILQGTKTPGWTSIMVLTSLNSSLVLLMLSIIGEYIIRIVRFTNEGIEYLIRDSVE
jgi:glycosyltransferase involved in cell wall biosynthesis